MLRLARHESRCARDARASAPRGGGHRARASCTCSGMGSVGCWRNYWAATEVKVFVPVAVHLKHGMRSSVRSRNPKSGSPYYILIEFLTERQTVSTLSIYRVFRVLWQFSKGNQCEPPPFKTHGNSNIIHIFRINDVHLSGETGPSKERTNICCNFRSTEVH